ncbi:Sensor histidine kinase RcsC [Pseudomonas fluorescens]|uniref:hybrid sensor histidine kinase/response regulator n=1 Tax=Pseudomonas fluorescens TaxID=294 RepID=UPI0012556002|nr:Hpt domain-containing protein [Pseudomonas fluorescens]CAG8864192.1 Sensor histidine kinase RcsC [Pseudomonas fluorescens]
MANAAQVPLRHDTVALAWTKPAILECLVQARQALEQFAGAPADTAVLKVFLDNLHQVHGCLRMLELPGATCLAEEMELLGKAFAEEQILPRGDCLGALFRGLEQLPAYLERLRSARHDLPLVMLPLLNQLRGCRGVEPLAQGSLMGGVQPGQVLAGPEDLANLDLPLGGWREHMEAGQGRDALRSVVRALCDDLMRIKERLDVYGRGDRQQHGQLEPLLAPLRQVADTLAVLGFQQPRRVIINQVLAVQSLALGQRAPDDALLMDVAGALLYVEATLNGMVGPLEEGGQLPGTGLAEIRQLVLAEALTVLQQAKELIGDCLESGWSRQRLQALPDLLQQIRGAMTMLMLPGAAAVLGGCAQYARNELLGRTEALTAPELEHLANALSASECCLQWLIADPLADTAGFVEQARQALSALGVRCEVRKSTGVLSNTLQVLAISDAGLVVEVDSGLDPQLLDIFHNEANGHLATLEGVLEEAVRHGVSVITDNLQRALHTLKGSAAMAGVVPVAQLATALDRLAREYKAHQLSLLPDDLELLEEALRLLRRGLAQLGSTPLAPIAGAEHLIEQVDEAVDMRLLALQDTPDQARRPRRDPQLIASFLAQGMDILLDAESLLSRWQEHPGERQELDALLDELTTLGQGAHLADLWQVDEVCEALLDLYGAVEEGSLGASARFFAQAQHAHEALIDMLDEIAAGQEVTARPECLEALRGLLDEGLAPSATGLVSRDNGVTELSRASAMALGVPLPEDSKAPGDNELLDIFLDESSDIVESAGAALGRWQAEPRNLVEVENLLRDLHTLKGGARMVEIAAIGDLAHELEFLYELLAAGQLPPSLALFSLLQSCHDRLAQMLDAVRLGQPLHAATALIDYIRNFSSAALADTAAGQGKRDPGPAETPAAVHERAPGDMVKVAAELLDNLGNLAGEHSIIRGRIEQQVNDAQVALGEMETTLERMRDQLRRLDTETQGQISSRQQAERDAYEDFDPLELDRHSQLQQLSRALFESASDLLDLKETLTQQAQQSYSLLQQQARVNSQLQEGLTGTRMVPFERLVPRLQRVVRQVASELGKQVELVVGNAEGELDRSVLERMVAPLEHMLRNAVDHGLETGATRLAAGKPEQGTISLNLLHEGADIVIEMTDDGAGVPLEAVRRKAVKRGLLDPEAHLSDHEVMQFILRPGFSTAEKITQISGRGLGMDVVHEEVKQLGGSMSIESSPGEGARFLIRLPFTVSINRALMVNLGEEQFAIPLNTIEGIVRVPPGELQACYQGEAPYYTYAGHRYELRYLGELVQGTRSPRLLGQSVPLPVLLVHSQEQSFAVQVDSFSPSREIVVKSLGPQFAAVPGLSGATLLGDGRVVLILDLLGQLRGLQRRRTHLPGGTGERTLLLGQVPRRPLLVMVVDDSVTMRKVTGRLLERHGMNVLTAKDGVDAMALLDQHRPDVLLLDIEMPRMDGFEVATRVRSDERFKDLPIIMVTSRTGQKHRERAMAIGVNDYLGKPYQESVLLQSIAQWSNANA